MKFKTETSAGGIVYKKLTSKVENLKSNGVWLITQHSKHKGWGFPKGLIGDKNSKEKMEEAALREVDEEGGVKTKIVSDKPVEVKYKYRFGEYLVDKTVYYFLMEYTGGDITKHDHEMEAVEWLPKEKVEKRLTYKSDQKVWQVALRAINRRLKAKKE